MKISLDQLEARLQSLIEGSVARLFPISNNQEDLAQRLVQAMRSNIHPQEDGHIWAPNLYLLTVHPAQEKIIQNRPQLLDELAQLLQQTGNEAGLEFPSTPKIQVSSEPEMGLNDTRILAQFELAHSTTTTIIKTQNDGRCEKKRADAFLIIDGMHVHPLNGNVANIGRSSSNDIVLDDIRVSRSHAQLRYINGRYVIFDLDSTGGTYVNRQRVRQMALHAGDLISLAGVPLVYGQDSLESSGETQEMPPSYPQV
jgi:hypothetical protein